MGALRAAELHTFGMEGVGKVFEAFRDGVYNDDDEVAVAHAAAEHGFRSLSDAMVNVRDALAEAERRGLISPATAEALVLGAKKLFYPNRSWPRIFQMGRDQNLPAVDMAALEAFVVAERPNLKRADAARLLNQLAAEGPTVSVGKPLFAFESSWFWKKLMATEERRRDALRPCTAQAGSVDQAALVRHVRAWSPQREELLRAALLLYLIDRYENPPTTEAAPVTDNGSTPARLERLERLTTDLMSTRAADLDLFLPLELRRRGVFERVAQEVQSKWQNLRDAGITTLDLEATGLDENQVLAWIGERQGKAPPPDFETLAVELGFASVAELIHEVAAHYLADPAQKPR
jgi:hypothetical protein